MIQQLEFQPQQRTGHSARYCPPHERQPSTFRDSEFSGKQNFRSYMSWDFPDRSSPQARAANTGAGTASSRAGRAPAAWRSAETLGPRMTTTLKIRRSTAVSHAERIAVYTPKPLCAYQNSPQRRLTNRTGHRLPQLGLAPGWRLLPRPMSGMAGTVGPMQCSSGTSTARAWGQMLRRTTRIPRAWSGPRRLAPSGCSRWFWSVILFYTDGGPDRRCSA